MSEAEDVVARLRKWHWPDDHYSRGMNADDLALVNEAANEIERLRTNQSVAEVERLKNEIRRLCDDNERLRRVIKTNGEVETEYAAEIERLRKEVERLRAVIEGLKSEKGR